MPSTQSDHPAMDDEEGVGLSPARIEALINELTTIRRQLLDADRRVPPRVHPGFGPSAANLLHFLTLRQRDLRPLQAALAELGLSSLGRSESHVLATIDAVLTTPHRLTNRSDWSDPDHVAPVSFQSGMECLREHTRLLLGAERDVNRSHIMVTMPPEAAGNKQLNRDLLANGMDCALINCAHDGPDVMKYRRRRDIYGRVIEPARLWLCFTSPWWNLRKQRVF